MFVCSSCDAQSPKWSGRCMECGKWGTIAEGGTPTKLKSVAVGRAIASGPLSLHKTAGATVARVATGNEEIDRVLGGGFVPSSFVLLSGEPGIGKSTLVAAVAGAVAGRLPVESQDKVLYISGEESGMQLAKRFERLGLDGKRVHFLEAHPIEDLIATLEKEQPVLAIIDSVQTVGSSTLEGAVGSPTLVRMIASLLLDFAKKHKTIVMLIGQVTKDGSLAGPKTLEHLVDVVLSMEGDPTHAYRLLRASKNRFGSADEVGVFEMTSAGCIPVPNPSARFLEERTHVPGSVLTATVEGSRVFLVEVQALVERTHFGMPVRRASGFDQNRLQMLCAILSKRAGIQLSESDIYLNVVGGFSLDEPAADLAVCAAIASAVQGTVFPDTLFVGEVGLGGEIRSVPLLERRLAEAKRLGIIKATIPQNKRMEMDGIVVQPLTHVKELRNEA